MLYFSKIQDDSHPGGGGELSNYMQYIEIPPKHYICTCMHVFLSNFKMVHQS